MKVPQLKELCGQYKLSNKGKKADLIKRIHEYSQAEETKRKKAKEYLSKTLLIRYGWEILDTFFGYICI